MSGSTTPEKMCHCGKPLHYPDYFLEVFIERQIEKHGEFQKVTDSRGIPYSVPRHYIGLHGCPTEEKVATLGFQVAEPFIECPYCHRISFNPTDIKEEYCGFCGKFHFDLPGNSVE